MARIAGLVAAVALVLVGPAPGSSISSGVKGVVNLSHGCPGPVRTDERQRCPTFPGKGVLVEAFASGATSPAGADRADARGRFAIPLPPGSYVLRADVAKAKPDRRPVAVMSGRWTRVALLFLVPPYML